ncbi:MAG: hypothetical protein K8T89_10030 [Planctomycetes bacterium]|nr:hypothetical protein [Planctomycetota bacterium]
MAITQLTRGHIIVRIGGKSANIQCEMLIPTTGLSDSLIYSDSIRNWQPPFDDEAIDPTTKEAIVREACDHLIKTGRVPEIV